MTHVLSRVHEARSFVEPEGQRETRAKSGSRTYPYWLGMILFWTAFLTLITSFTIKSSALTLSFDADKNGWQAGLLINGGFLAQAIGACVLGWLGDRVGRYRPLLVALLCGGVGGIGVSLAWSWPSLLGFRWLQSFGLGALLPLVLTIYTDMASPSDAWTRSRTALLLAAWYAWGTFFMSLIARPITVVFGDWWGWRLLHLGGSCGLLCYVGYAIWSRYWFDGDRATEKAVVSIAEEPGAVSPRWGQFVLLWLQWFLAYFLVTAYSNGLPLLFREFGLEKSALQTTLVYGCLTIALLYVFAYGVRKGGYQRWMIAGYMIALAAIAIVGNGMLFSLFSNQLLFWISTCISSGSFLVVYGLYQSGFHFPRTIRARGLAVARVVQCLATILAPLSTPLLYKLDGINGILFFWFFLTALGWVMLDKWFASLSQSSDVQGLRFWN